MRIKKPAKPSSGSPAAALIDQILMAPDDQLATILHGPASAWEYPRADLAHWSDVLNRFDAILEHVIADYALAEVQMNAFTPRTKELVLAILLFTRTLLDNANNKKIFSGYDRLADLYLTLDLDVLESTLRLALKPAQLYRRQDSVGDERLLRLAQAWPTSGGLKLGQLAADGAVPIAQDSPTLEYSFYRRASAKEGPSSARPYEEGLVIITIPLPAPEDEPRSAVDLLADAIELHNIPVEARLSLFQRIRVALALARKVDGGAERRQLLLCRLLALATVAPSAADATLTSEVLMHDPAIVAELAELVHPDSATPMTIRGGALYALEGMSRIRTRSQEVMAALGAGVNHGVLLECVRRTVSDLDTDTPASTPDFIDALFTLLGSFQMHHHSAGHQLVGAGLIPLLIDIVRNPRPARLATISRAVSFLDTAAYSFPNASTAFFAGGGLSVFVERLQTVVDAISAAPAPSEPVADATTGPLQQTDAAFLKAVMRSIARMMQTGTPGTAEGLRNLIDSTLPATIRKVLDDREKFGSQIFALAINILTTFIHSEPTSLAILQEQKLPDHFYAAVQKGIDASIDVVSAVPNAIGALCLNEAGLKQFNDNAPAIMSQLFSVLGSDQHARVLAEREHASVFGAAVDELIRHHPSIKPSVINAIKDLVQSVFERGQNLPLPESGSARLVIAAPAAASTTTDVEMADAPAAQPAVGEASAPAATPEDKTESPFLVTLDVVSRFIEGFCSNPAHCKELVKTPALETIVKIGALPSLPLDFGASHAMRSYTAMLRGMGETSPVATLTAIMTQLKAALDDAADVVGAERTAESRLTALLAPASDAELVAASAAFGKIVRLQHLIYVLEQIFPHIGYSQSRSVVASSLQTLSEGTTFRQLGTFARACAWEIILLGPRPDVAAAGKAATADTADVTELTETLVPATVPAPSTSTASSSNATLIKQVLRNASTSFNVFIEHVISRPAPRRQQDASHKKEAVAMAELIARVVIDSLAWPTSGHDANDHSYAMIMLSTAEKLLFAERHVASTQSTLIITFNRLGGTKAVLDLYARFGHLATEAFPTAGESGSEGPESIKALLAGGAQDKRKLAMIQAAGGLRVALDVIERLSSRLSMPDLSAALRTESDKTTSVDPAAYLVELRLQLLPPVVATWRSPYFRLLPPNVVRAVFRTLYNILGADGESETDWGVRGGGANAAESATEQRQRQIARMLGGQGGVATGVLGGLIGIPAEPQPPDEERIRQLTDMGFPRSSSIRALTRYRNNTGAATDYLLNHPEVVAQGVTQDAADAARSAAGTPAPGAAPAAAAPADGAAAAPAVDADAIVPDEPAPSTAAVPTPPPAPVEAAPAPSPAAEHRKQLDEARTALKADFLQRALELIASYPQLVFDVRNACRSKVFGATVAERKGLDLVLDRLSERDPAAASGDDGTAAAAEMRLLALLASDSAFEATDPTRVRSLAANWLETAAAKTSDAPAKWIAPLLLVLEAVFENAEAIKTVEPLAMGVTDDQPPPTDETVFRGPAMLDERQMAFDLALRLLQRDDADADLIGALTRILLVVTRSASLATAFLNADGIPLLLALNQRPVAPEGTQELSMLIIRHVIEGADAVAMQALLEAAIAERLGRRASHQAEAATFVAENAGAALRDPIAFMRAVEAYCTCLGGESTIVKPKVVPRAKSAASAAVADEPAKKDGGEMQVDEPAVTAVTEATLETPNEGVEKAVHVLMASLQASIRAAKTDDASTVATELKHARFVLSVLIELVSSYTACKTSFVRFSRTKPDKGEAGPAGPKSRASFLSFLLTEIIGMDAVAVAQQPKPTPITTVPVPTAPIIALRLADYATLLVTALCSDVTPAVPFEPPSQALTLVRKHVLDVLAKAYKDAGPSATPLATEATAIRYARIGALSDLALKLIAPAPDPRRAYATSRLAIGAPDQMQMQMAKLMLETNFAVTLTNTVAEIDLNYPDVRDVLNRILKPLQQLSRVVTKVGRAASAAGRRQPDPVQAAIRAAAVAMGLDDGEGSDGEDGDEDDDDDDEGDATARAAHDEAAMDEDDEDDPYRSSALGMHTGHLEAGGGPQPGEGYDDSDDDMDQDGDDMEMMDIDPDAGLVPSDLSSQEGDVGQGFRDEMDEDDDDDIEDGEGDEDDDEDGPDEGDELDDMIDDADIDMLGPHDHVHLPEDAVVNLVVQPADGAQVTDDEEDPQQDGFFAEDIVDMLNHAAAPLADHPAMEGNTDDDASVHDDEHYPEDEDEDELGPGAAGLIEFDDPIGMEAHEYQRALQAESRRLQTRHRALGIVTPGQGGLREIGQHPLLVDTSPAESAQRRPASTVDRRRQRRDMPVDMFQRVMETLQGFGGPPGPDGRDPLEALEAILDGANANVNALGGGAGLARVGGPGPGAGGLLRDLDEDGYRQLEALFGGGAGRQSPATTDATPTVPDPHPPTPAATLVRWDQESRLLQGAVTIAHRLDALTMHVVNLLRPAARREALVQAEKAREAAEQERKKALAEAEEEERKKKDAAEAEAAKAAAAAPSQDAEMVDATPAPAPAAEPEVTDDVAAVMAMARAFGNPPPPPVASGSGAAATPAPAPPAPAEPAAPARVTVLVHGAEVDITDTGIDRDFLEALPDNMREEIINEHFRERRRTARPPAAAAPAAAGGSGTGAARLVAGADISSEFLDALPPDIRAEVLASEAAEAARAARGAQGGGGGGGAIEMDPSTFFATFDDPELRANVLMEQMGQPGFLASLSPDLLAEVEAIRADQRGRVRRAPRAGAVGVPAAAGAAPGGGKGGPTREPVQLLDKAGVATLVRLLFMPQALDRPALQTILGNLCDHAKTRLELLTILLSILQDGTRDAGAVDRTFSQMSLRATKPTASTSTRVPIKRRATGDPSTPGGALPTAGLNDLAPNLVLQRCLDALQHLVAANEATSAYFLTEQESLAAAAAASRSVVKSSKKSRGKEKARDQSGAASGGGAETILPLVVLLGLLERPGLQKTPAMMDALTSLLSAVTKPLIVLGQPVPEEKKADPAPVAAEGAPAAPVAGGSGAPAPAVVVPPIEGTGTPAEPVMSENAPAVKVVREKPPDVPERSLRLVVASLDGECSSKTFQHTLALIQHCSYLPGARDLISSELVTRAQQYGHAVQPDLAELTSALEAASGSATTVPAELMQRFTPATATQTKLLRVLKTLDHMFTRKSTLSPAALDEERLHQIFLGLDFRALWAQLSDALAAVEGKDTHIVTVLLPLVESLMVVAKSLGSSPMTPRAAPVVTNPLSPGGPAPAPMTPRDAMEQTFTSFTRKHRASLNALIRANPGLIGGSFSILIKTASVLDFDNKRGYFNQQLHRGQPHREDHRALHLNVRRQYIFEDSFQNWQRRSAESIKHGRLSVRFFNEEGVDAGGVTREWGEAIAKAFSNPNYALFTPSASDALVYHPNPASSINPDHLLFYRFVGRVIAKSVYDGRTIPAFFSQSLYKQILGKPVEVVDLESIDPDGHRSLKWILDNPIDEAMLDLTFSTEADNFGVTEVVDLKPDGRKIAVDDSNKREYVELVARQRLTESVKDQVNALVGGFYEIVPKELIGIFAPNELQLLISGLPELDADEWRNATEYGPGLNASSPSVVLFWRAVRAMSQEDRAKLLQFATGSSRVPLGGFASLIGVSGVTRFSLCKGTGLDVLPTSHTYQLDLPEFSTYEECVRLLKLAINEGAGSFGFA